MGPDIIRSGQQAALGADVLALMDALGMSRAILAGYDWGGRAACVAAALHPERVIGLVTVNGYLIQDIRAAMHPLRPDLEAGFWYFFYFLTERGRAGLAANRRDIAEVIWRRNSPKWHFGVADLDRTAKSFDNPDYVDVVIHSYRHRLGLAAGAPDYADAEAALALAPVITVPAVTLDGTADGNFPATRWKPRRGALHRPAAAPSSPRRRAQPAAGGPRRDRHRHPGRVPARGSRGVSDCLLRDGHTHADDLCRHHDRRGRGQHRRSHG